MLTPDLVLLPLPEPALPTPSPRALACGPCPPWTVSVPCSSLARFQPAPACCPVSTGLPHRPGNEPRRGEGAKGQEGHRAWPQGPGVRIQLGASGVTALEDSRRSPSAPLGAGQQMHAVQSGLGCAPRGEGLSGARCRDAPPAPRRHLEACGRAALTCSNGCSQFTWDLDLTGPPGAQSPPRAGAEGGVAGHKSGGLVLSPYYYGLNGVTPEGMLRS